MKVRAANGFNVDRARSPQQRAEDARVCQMMAEADGGEFGMETFYAFALNAHRLTDGTYWQMLGTLWVGGGFVGGNEDEDTRYSVWRTMFTAGRPRRREIMKAPEIKRLRALPARVRLYRAMHPEQRADRVFNFSLNPSVAAFYARENGGAVRAFEADRRDVVAVFTRRGEAEVITFHAVQATTPR